ncbi:MAG: tetraacyldisaccharide 4'-kinase [Bacteroidetes bacterium]|nr:tetraacyldisaccharide 4'-kinase [Bacteroidota bacterium]
MGILKAILYPFSLLYWFGTWCRNFLYDRDYLRSLEFTPFIITVGNLSVGGTGKTPMIEYLLRLLGDDIQVAMLSRGYKRKTQGFRLADENDSARTIGDEPFQIYLKFNKTVAVGEDRALAIPELMSVRPDTKIILMDDAFQHRSVKSDINILLTDYNRPFFNDHLLPAGRLRESRAAAGRAQIVIVSKCPSDISDQEMEAYKNKISFYTLPGTPVFYTRVQYQPPVALNPEHHWMDQQSLILISGIAATKPWVKHLGANHQILSNLVYGDHHYFNLNDIQKLKKIYIQNQHHDPVIITTEKDSVRLMDPVLNVLLKDLPVFYFPIKTVFFKNGEVFDSMILESLKNQMTVKRY